MSAIINKLAMALKEGDDSTPKEDKFALEDIVEIVGIENVDNSGKKIKAISEKRFKLSDKDSIDGYLAGHSPLGIRFYTKEGEKLIYSLDQYVSNKWNLINVVTNKMIYCLRDKHARVRDISI